MRLWKSSSADDGSIHCLGNGRLCAYEQGPDLIQVFGPPYSSPAFYRFSLVMDAGFEVHCERQAGAAIWTHRLFSGGAAVGEMVDFVAGELPCLVRRLRLSVPLHFRLALRHPGEGLALRHPEASEPWRGSGEGLALDPPVSVVDNGSR